MDRGELMSRLARARSLLSQGFAEQAVEASASTLESVMRWLLVSPTAAGITATEYFRIAPGLATAINEQEKSADRLGLGELIGVYNKGGMFAALSSRSGAQKFGEFQAGRIRIVNERRIGSYHQGKTTSDAEAEQCLMIVETGLLELNLVDESDLKTLRDKAFSAIVAMNVNNLPQPPYREFIGRKGLTDEISAVFREGNPKLWAVQLTGEGGIGKTALAYHIAEQLFSDGTFASVFWFSGKLTRLTPHGVAKMRDSAPGLPELCVAVLDAFGEAIRPGVSDVTWVRRRAAAHLGAQRTLVVIDNWETIQDETVTAFLEGLPTNVALLSTTRVKVGGHKVVELTGLSQEEARSLAVSALGPEHAAAARLSSSSDLAHELWRVSSGNALAVTLIAAWVQEGLDLGTSLKKLTKYKSGLHDFLYHELFNQLLPIERDVLFVLTCSDRPLTKPEIGFVLSADSDDIDASVLRLLKFSMILDRSNLQEPDDRFRVAYVARPLAATFAQKRMDHDAALRVRMNNLKIKIDNLRVVHESEENFIAVKSLTSDGDRFLVRQCSDASGSDDSLQVLREISTESPESIIPRAFLAREYYRENRIKEARDEIARIPIAQLAAHPNVLALAWSVGAQGGLPASFADELSSPDRLRELDPVSLHKAATVLGRMQKFDAAREAHTLGIDRCRASNDERQLSYFLVGRAENALQLVTAAQLRPIDTLSVLDQAEKDLLEARDLGLTVSSIISNKFTRLNESRRRARWQRDLEIGRVR